MLPLVAAVESVIGAGKEKKKPKDKHRGSEIKDWSKVPAGLRNSFVIIEQKGAQIKGLTVH